MQDQVTTVVHESGLDCDIKVRALGLKLIEAADRAEFFSKVDKVEAGAFQFCCLLLAICRQQFATRCWLFI